MRIPIFPKEGNKIPEGYKRVKTGDRIKEGDLYSLKPDSDWYESKAIGSYITASENKFFKYIRKVD